MRCFVFDHELGRVIRGWQPEGGAVMDPLSDAPVGVDIGSHLLAVARQNPDAWIGWRRARSVEVEPPRLNLPAHERICAHVGLSDRARDSVAELGFVDQMEGVWRAGPDRRMDWLLSSRGGLIHASVLIELGWWSAAPNFRVGLLDLGRRASRQGVLCLIEPDVIRGGTESSSPRIQPLAGLVRRWLGPRWLLFWAWCRVVHGPRRRMVPVEFVRALGGEARAGAPVARKASRPAIRTPTTDAFGSVSVVVPTLGRPRSVATLLRDLSRQSMGVREVIVVAQHADQCAAPDLPDDLPYTLRWIDVDWAGACRSRNLALSRASGDWALFLDDDVRCPPEFVETFAREIRRWGIEAASARVVTPGTTVAECEKFGGAFPQQHLEGEERERGPDWMWPGFAGGASMVRMDFARTVDGFDERLDLGYGEDFDFGLRLRGAGARFLLLQRPFVVHYHEQVGGFRTPIRHPWHGKEEPKPSPYILHSRGGLHPNCGRGYSWLYRLPMMIRAPWSAPGVLRRWRSARRWAGWLRARPFGGIHSWSERDQARPDGGQGRPQSDRESLDHGGRGG